MTDPDLNDPAVREKIIKGAVVRFSDKALAFELVRAQVAYEACGCPGHSQVGQLLADEVRRRLAVRATAALN